MAVKQREPSEPQRIDPQRSGAPAPGDLFIVSAPSGAGKTTLIRSLTDGPTALVDRLHFAVSHTTRRARPGEVAGRDYHFVSPSQFDAMVAEDRFLEWAVVHGNRYGTSLAEVQPQLAAGWDVLLDIDVQGAIRILEERHQELPSASALVTVFILPPSFRALRERLVQRGNTDAREVERRLHEAHREIAQIDRYQYVIVNRDAVSATRVLGSIIVDKRHRRPRMAGAVADLLADAGQSSGEAAAPASPHPRQ